MQRFFGASSVALQGEHRMGTAVRDELAAAAFEGWDPFGVEQWFHAQARGKGRGERLPK